MKCKNFAFDILSIAWQINDETHTIYHDDTYPVEEIIDAGLLAPSINQLVLSPFNQHKDVVAWTENQRTILSCNAWSKLSSGEPISCSSQKHSVLCPEMRSHV